MNNTLKYHEERVRKYSNLVTITYECIEDAVIYINSIRSEIPNRGNGTQAMKKFLDEHKKYDIYIFSSSELGTSKEVLDKWYESLGFMKCDRKDLKYNVTHMKPKR